jgi:hypothetical protein
MGRPIGTKNGSGRGTNRANGGSSKDFAPSTSIMVRLQRPQTIADLEEIATNGLQCSYCLNDMTYKAWINITIDHVVAHSKGGTNQHPNLISVCRRCNESKSDQFTATQFAFLQASSRENPTEHLAEVNARIAAQVTGKVNSELGRIVHLAWRELAEGMTTRDEYRQINLYRLVTRAIEIARDVPLKKAA